MKVYIFYTKSHKILLDEWFLPSIKPEYNADLDITEFEQKCQTAKLNSNGWLETMFFKIDTILKGINENIDKPNNVFIHSDIDIQFFGNFIKDCSNEFAKQNYDILFQIGGRSICMGFFICRANEKTKKFFTDIKKKMKENKNNDEINAKLLLGIPKGFVEKKHYHFKRRPFKNNYDIKWGYLPLRKYISGKLVLISTTEERFKAPPISTIMHHATCTVGVKNKIKQLKYVRDYFLSL
jgi:hypothetical protein